MHQNPASRNWRKKGVLLASNYHRTIFWGKANQCPTTCKLIWWTFFCLKTLSSTTGWQTRYHTTTYLTMWKQILNMKWICTCMAVVGHALRDVHQRFVQCTATCSLIMAHKELSIWYNHYYMVARILAQMLANPWQPGSPENVWSNIIHNETKMSRWSSVLQPHKFHESSDSKLQYLCGEQ